MTMKFPGLVIRGLGPYQLDGYDFKTAYKLWQEALDKDQLLSFLLGPEPIVIDPKEVIALVTMSAATLPSGADRLAAALKNKTRPH